MTRLAILVPMTSAETNFAGDIFMSSTVAPVRMLKDQPSAQPVAKTAAPATVKPATPVRYVPTVRTVLTPSKPQAASIPPAAPARPLAPAPSATTSGITSSADLLARISGSANAAAAAATGEGEISRLLTLFPKAKRVNIPMLVRVVADGKEVWDWEKDWIMYVAADSAIFPSNLPLRGNETLMFRRPGESAMTPGVVVAMQYDGARVIVAVRFVTSLPEWLNNGG